MAKPLDPTAAAFLLSETRNVPMHVGGLQLFEKPEGAGPGYVREMYEQMRDVDRVSRLFLQHPYRSPRTAGQYMWVEDEQFDMEHHVRHSALPQPGRIRELLDLVGRLHSARLDYDRPLWQAHVIEGLADGRVGLYTKIHHAMLDGVSAMRLLQSVLSTDPGQREMPAPWAQLPEHSRIGHRQEEVRDLAEVSAATVRKALGLTAEAAGLPGAFVKTVQRSLRNETSALSLFAPRTILNQPITGSRRFAADHWELSRIRAVGRSTGATLNDVVIAMCSGALRRYLLDANALPDAPMVAMVPVSLRARRTQYSSASGGNAIGSIMTNMATDLPDAEARLRAIHRSMLAGKQALATMTPVQIVAMSAIGQAPAVLPSLLRMGGVLRPPYNVVISNVPGPRKAHYWNGAEMLSMYPLSIPIDGMALNITCASYNGLMCFGLTGCRRTVPHLQRLLTYLDEELAALEKVAGI